MIKQPLIRLTVLVLCVYVCCRTSPTPLGGFTYFFVEIYMFEGGTLVLLKEKNCTPTPQTQYISNCSRMIIVLSAEGLAQNEGNRASPDIMLTNTIKILWFWDQKHLLNIKLKKNMTQKMGPGCKMYVDPIFVKISYLQSKDSCAIGGI